MHQPKIITEKWHRKKGTEKCHRKKGTEKWHRKLLPSILRRKKVMTYRDTAYLKI